MNEATRISWKYGTSRYTTGTPHFLVRHCRSHRSARKATLQFPHHSQHYLPSPLLPQVNGLPVDDILGDGTLASWQAIIDPLLAPSKAGGGSKRFPRKVPTFRKREL